MSNTDIFCVIKDLRPQVMPGQAENPPSGGRNSRGNGNNRNQKRNENPYNNWSSYFDNEAYTKDSPTVKKIRIVENFVTRHQNLFPSENLEVDKAYNVDVKMLLRDETFSNEWNTFIDDLTNDPNHTLNCLRVAINQIVAKQIRNVDGINDLTVLAHLPVVKVRVSNFGPVIPLHDLKVNSLGKLISIRGCIMRIGSVRHVARWIEFGCKSCKCRLVIKQPDGNYTVPSKCTICGGKMFDPLLSSPNTKTVPFNVIRMQEHLGDDQEDRGRMPRTIEVELIEEDLVDTCMPGDDVTVTGIVKVRGNEGTSTKFNATSNLFALYVEAVFILNNKYKSQNKTVADLDLSVSDLYSIQQIYRGENIFKLLVHSLCPSIYGHEIIKAGFILSLFGGSARSSDSRDEIHVLIVGDPGLGKSQLLQACSRIAPKGVYISGNSSTSAGLTAALARDPGTGDFVLEPGALVLADKGCCCIDEFDKMTPQHQALLEAMEQQSVSLAKSGIVCCLPSRTAILAAANPIGGRYNYTKKIENNLNMSQPLLSRFDLIFVILDQPEQHLDNLVSKHVMALHFGETSQATSSQSLNHRSSNNLFSSLNRNSSQSATITDSQNIDLIPHNVLRNYISYARQYVKPTITSDAAQMLQNFYLQCRNNQEKTGITPMSPRQLKALIRLTEARAKLELREEATADDASDVIRIFEYSLAAPTNENPNFRNPGAPDSGKITGKKVQSFIKLLKNHSASNNVCFTSAEMKEMAVDAGVVIDDFNAFIAKINEQGAILLRGPNLYSFNSNY